MQANALQQLGNLITVWRKRRGLTQQALAAKVKTSQSALNRLEHGKQNPTLDLIARLSEALDASLITLTPPTRLDLTITGGNAITTSITINDIAADWLSQWLNVANLLGIPYQIVNPATHNDLFTLQLEIDLPLKAKPLLEPNHPANCFGIVLLQLSRPGVSLFYDIYSLNYQNYPLYKQLINAGANIEILRFI